jgi:hypothetical protein
MSQARRIPRFATLVVALSLTGCWGGTPVTPEAPVVPVAVAATPAVSVSDEFATLQGTVALRGMPWKQAKLQVVDALTGKPAGTPGSALRAEGTMETDANGNFSIRVAGLGVGKVARVIATLDSGTLTALVGQEGPVAAAYTVQATGFSMQITEVTLCLDQVASGVLRMAGGLKSEAAAALIKTVLKDLAAMTPKLTEAFDKDDMLAITLSLTASPLTGLVPDGLPVTNLLAKAGLTDAVDAAVKTATNSVAALAKDKLNVADAGALENVNLIGTSLKIAIEGGVFKVTDPKTGESITIDLEAAPPVSNPTPPKSGSGNNAPSVAFNPTATFDTAGDTIRLRVTQAPGESDIASIVVKVPVVPAIGAVQVDGLIQSNPTERIQGAGGQIQIGNIASMNLSVNEDAGLGPIDLTGLPSSPFGQTLNYAAGIEKDGYLVVPTLTTATLGHVRVFTGNDAQRWWAAENVYVAAKYTDRPEFKNATSLKTAHGHATYLDFSLKNNVTFANNGSLVIQVRVTPRSPGAVAKTVTATYDADVL